MPNRTWRTLAGLIAVGALSAAGCGGPRLVPVSGTVLVNGKKVNEAFDVAPRAGQIQLQSELAEIFFRRWELWPLGKGPKPEPAK